MLTLLLYAAIISIQDLTKRMKMDTVYNMITSTMYKKIYIISGITKKIVYRI